MLRTTTLLIVTVLAGGPASSLACELWCSSAAAEDHHRAVGCHDASQNVPTGQQVRSTTGCHAAATTTPFVTEARQTDSANVAGPLAHVDSSSIGPDSDETTAGRCVFNVQPRRPTSARTLLRV